MMILPTEFDQQFLSAILLHGGSVPKAWAKRPLSHLNSKGYLRSITYPECTRTLYFGGNMRTFNRVTEAWGLSRDAERAARTLFADLCGTNVEFSLLGDTVWKPVSYPRTLINRADAHKEIKSWCFANDVALNGWAHSRSYRHPRSEILVEEEHEILFMMRWT